MTRSLNSSVSNPIPLVPTSSETPSSTSASGRASGSAFANSERAPGLDRGRKERERIRVEPGLALRARRAQQRSIEIVGPRVVRALQGRAAALAVRDECARCRHTFLKPRSSPSRPRTATTGTCPTRPATYPPGLSSACGAADVLPGAAKIRSRSRAAIAGSEYQVAGSVQPAASVSDSVPPAVSSIVIRSLFRV